MILVIDAGYHGMVAFSACSTLPLSASTRISASADALGALKPNAAQAEIATISARVVAEGCAGIKCRSGRLAGLGNTRFHGRKRSAI
jgi:hypothetical protein